LRVLGAVKSPLITRAFDVPDADTDELVVISSPFFRTSCPTVTRTPRVGGALRQWHAHSQPQAPRRAAARTEGPLRHHRIRSKGNEALVFSRTAMLAATDEILTDNGVRAQGSANMMAVWQEKTAK